MRGIDSSLRPRSPTVFADESIITTEREFWISPSSVGCRHRVEESSHHRHAAGDRRRLRIRISAEMSDRHHPAEFAVSEIQILPPWTAAERGSELAHRASAIAPSFTHQRILRASGWHGRLMGAPATRDIAGTELEGSQGGVTIILQELGVPAARIISEKLAADAAKRL